MALTRIKEAFKLQCLVIKNMSHKEAWRSPNLTVQQGTDETNWLGYRPIDSQAHTSSTLPTLKCNRRDHGRSMSYKWWTLLGAAHNLPPLRTSMFCPSSLTHTDVEILGVPGLPFKAWRAVVCQPPTSIWTVTEIWRLFMAAARVIPSPIYHINIFFSKMNLKTLL